MTTVWTGVTGIGRATAHSNSVEDARLASTCSCLELLLTHRLHRTYQPQTCCLKCASAQLRMGLMPKTRGMVTSGVIR